MKFQMNISYLYYENLFRKLCKCFILPIFSLFFFLIIVLLTYSITYNIQTLKKEMKTFINYKVFCFELRLFN